MRLPGLRKPKKLPAHGRGRADTVAAQQSARNPGAKPNEREIWLGAGHHLADGDAIRPQTAMAGAEQLSKIGTALSQQLQDAAERQASTDAGMIAGEWKANIDRVDEQLRRSIEDSGLTEADGDTGQTRRVSAADYNAASLQVIDARRQMQEAVRAHLSVITEASQQDMAAPNNLRKTGRDAALAAWTAAIEVALGESENESRSPGRRAGHREQAERLGTGMRELLTQGDGRGIFQRRGRRRTKSLEDSAKGALHQLEKARQSSKWIRE